MSSIEETMTQVTSLKNSLENVKTQISTLTHVKNSLSDLTHSLDPKSSAELSISLAFAASSLYFMMLKTKGVATSSHPIKDDLTRIKQYVGKVRQFDTKNDKVRQFDTNKDKVRQFDTKKEEEKEEEEESSKKRRKIAVNSEAVKRVVQHELSRNNIKSSTTNGVEVEESKAEVTVSNTPSSKGKKNSGKTNVTPTSQKKKKKKQKK